MFEIGTRVKIFGTDPYSGRVRTWTTLTRSPEFTVDTSCIVELDRGFWSEDHKIFVTLLVCHPDNLVEIKEGVVVMENETVVGTTIYGKGKLHVWKLFNNGTYWGTSLCGLDSVPIICGSMDDDDACSRCRKSTGK